MKPEEIELWTQRMEEASFLPSDDPIRQELERDLAEQSTALRDQWLSILSETEELRLQTLNVRVPPNLENRLLNDMEVMDSPSIFQHTLKKWAPLAAMLLLGIFIGRVWNGASAPSQDSVQQIAFLATDDHINDRRLSVTTSDLDMLERKLNQAGRLQPSFPTPAPGFQLVGGRHCYWGQEKVVYSLWKKDGMEYSLIQFDPQGMKISENHAPEIICCDSGLFNEKPVDLIVWVENGRGYTLVGRQGSVPPDPWKNTVF